MRLLQLQTALGMGSLKYKSVFLFLAGTGLAFGADAQPQLNARELFYSAPRTAAAAQQATPAVKAPRPARPTSVHVDVNPEDSKVQTPPSQASASRSEPLEPTDGVRIVPASAVSTAALVPDSSPTPSGPPLGLKYSVLKKAGEDMVEVPADTIFRAGDRIRISVETNQPGYLYIINRGSSGTWKPLFPSTEVEDGNNHVDGFHDYMMPPKSRMVFDETTGVEKLFLVFSREPEPNLEKVIYSLTGGTAPGSDAQSGGKNKTLLAVNSPGIDDATVGILRTTNSRDLVIEHVDERTPGEKKETAVYVVNPAGRPDSRVVADLALVHQ